MSSSRSWPWASEMTVSMSSDLNTTDVSQCLIMSRQINSDFPSSDVRTLCLIDTHIKTSTISRLFLISSTVKWWYLVMPTLLRAFSNLWRKETLSWCFQLEIDLPPDSSDGRWRHWGWPRPCPPPCGCWSAGCSCCPGSPCSSSHRTHQQWSDLQCHTAN